MRLTDITGWLHEAAARMPSWNAERYQAASAAIIKAQSSLRLDWEPGDEAWARFFEGDNVVALLRESAPLAVVVGNEASAGLVARTLSEHEIVVIRAGSWDAEEFMLNDPESRIAVGLGWQDYDDSTDLSSFSVADLWYETLEEAK